ncbi:MAG TPA: hypothetical protein VGZ48_13880 [Candidatus Acidoferrales bacterium]|jgi:hypothetical protein|nr:hypothetical protein [Candidatus Acidoferrales bacterium]
MRSKSLRSLVAFLAVMALVVPAFARDINRIVSVPNQTKIAGKTLKAGDYTFKVSDNKVTIELNHKLVAEASGRWEPRDSKWASDSLVVGADGQVREIRFGGEKRVFIVSGQ